MKRIHLLFVLAFFATSAIAQLPPTNPVAPAVKPATNAIVPLTDIAPPAATAGADAGLPARPARNPNAAPRTNAPAEFPAFPAFPTPPPRRGGAGATAAAGTPNPAGANPAATPGNVATPINPATPNAAPANNVAGRPAAAAPGATAGGGALEKLDDEEIIPAGIIKFQDADLLQVLDIYQDLTGRTVLRPSNLPQTKISVKSQTSLTRREAVQLLDTILAMNQITMIPQGAKFVKAVPESLAAPQAAEFLDPDSELENTTRYVTKIVQLKNALPREVGPILQPLAKMPNSIMAIDSSSILVLRDYEENVKRMEELLEKIDVVPMNEYEPIVIPIKYALAGDIAQVLSTLTAGGGGATTVGGRPAGTGLSTTPGLQGGGRGGAGGIGGFGNTGGLQGQQGYGNTLGGAGGGLGGAGFNSPAAGRSSFQDRLRSIVNRAASGSGEIVVIGNTKIIADERTNSLLVFATRGDLETITNIIAKLDVVLAQVVIEAIIMEVSLDDTLNYGFSYLQKNPTGSGNYSGIGAIRNTQLLNFGSFGQSGSSNNIIANGFSYFAKLGGDFEATATAIATDNRINVLQRPRIQTSHAVEANLFVGETRPYITGTYNYGYGGLPSSQYSQLQIGITLSVLPLINSDGLVVMDIRQKIQSIGGSTKIDGNDIPITIDREANAKVAVQTGETVMLGGFIGTDRSKNSSGVPLLKDLPLLGPLFRSTTKNLSRKELMVLIRPTVLPNPQIAAMVAKDLKSRMPGISSAEREAMRDERRQTRKLKVDEQADEKQLEEEEQQDLKASQHKASKVAEKEVYKKEGFTP